MPEADADFAPDVFDDTYFNIELKISRDGDRTDFFKVKKRLMYKEGMPIGRAHNNPILDTIMYELEYKGGNKASLVENVVSENMFSQVYGEVNRHVLFQDVVDHR